MCHLPDAVSLTNFIVCLFVYDAAVQSMIRLLLQLSIVSLFCDPPPVTINETPLNFCAYNPVNNLFGFASPFANHYQPAANQCNIWFAETANQHVGQGTGFSRGD